MKSNLIDFDNCVAKLTYEHDRFSFQDSIKVLFLVPSNVEGETVTPPSELCLDNVLALRQLNQYLTEYLGQYDERQKEREKRDKEQAVLLSTDLTDDVL